MHPPAPFIVGVARSGTTLLRLQLDAHPELCIPAETGFGLLVGGLTSAGAGPGEVVAALRRSPTWPDLGMDDGAMIELFETCEPWSVAAGLRAWYRLQAVAHGKRRWGDKTPGHAGCIGELAAAFPEARFIHIVRDGRDVLASMRGLPFAPGDGSVEAIALHWRETIAGARATAPDATRYREVRFERLVSEPEPVLRELCEFLQLPYDSAVLRAHERARDRLAELAPVMLADGTLRTPAMRRRLHARTGCPPDPSRAGRWRDALSGHDRARFERVAGDLLDDLGYR